jgi:RNA polymerase sigma-70 factor (ECF subfamily)
MAHPRVAFTELDAAHESRAHVELWDAHAQAIFRYCFRRSGDLALAEDLTSVVFLEAWRRRRDVSLAAEKRLPWLYGVATNVLRNQHRTRRRHEAALARLPRPPHEPDFADSIADRLDDERQMREILEQVHTLSRLEQEVLGLCAWEGLAPAEAALALGVPEATVRTRLHRAREHLRKLGDSGPPVLPRRDSIASQGELL